MSLQLRSDCHLHRSQQRASLLRVVKRLMASWSVQDTNDRPSVQSEGCLGAPGGFIEPACADTADRQLEGIDLRVPGTRLRAEMLGQASDRQGPDAPYPSGLPRPTARRSPPASRRDQKVRSGHARSSCPRPRWPAFARVRPEATLFPLDSRRQSAGYSRRPDPEAEEPPPDGPAVRLRRTETLRWRRGVGHGRVAPEPRRVNPLRNRMESRRAASSLAVSLPAWNRARLR